MMAQQRFFGLQTLMPRDYFFATLIFAQRVPCAAAIRRLPAALTLRMAVGAAQQIGNLPDEIRKFVMTGHRCRRLAQSRRLRHAFLSIPFQMRFFRSETDYWA